jgi:cytochrome d ubiquinol oxidase subunit I
LWAFGWKKLSKRAHALAMVVVAFATNLSALWITLANGWMQHPVGYALRNGRAEMTDFGALASNAEGWLIFGHTVLAGFVCAGFFVMAVSAYHLLRKNESAFFKASFRTAAGFALIASLGVAVVGDQQGVRVAASQPAKMAAMEAHWETRTGVPYTVLTWPDAKNGRNFFEFLKIPKGLSLLTFHKGNAEVRGLKDFPAEDRPPVWPTFISFKLMVVLGLIFILLSFLGWVRSLRDKLESNPLFLRVLLFSLPLPYLAIQLGWIVTEIGRQPWLVYGVLRTSEGVSQSISPGQVLFSLLGFSALYAFLAVIDIFLLRKHARTGPEEASR